jgi:hypothetical protein
MEVTALVAVLFQSMVVVYKVVVVVEVTAVVGALQIEVVGCCPLISFCRVHFVVVVLLLHLDVVSFCTTHSCQEDTAREGNSLVVGCCGNSRIFLFSSLFPRCVVKTAFRELMQTI